jgi:hypothetical protein
LSLARAGRNRYLPPPHREIAFVQPQSPRCASRRETPIDAGHRAIAARAVMQAALRQDDVRADALATPAFSCENIALRA